jgi:hypothetical protein
MHPWQQPKLCYVKGYILATFLILFMALARQGFAAVSIISQGTFPSPDGRFVLKIAPEINIYGVELPELILEDRRTRAVERSDPNGGEGKGLNVLTPIFFIKWTGDSKTILVISHIAHGTIGAELHFDGSTWHQRLLQPPSPDDGHFTVLSQHVGRHQIGISYAVDVAAGAETPHKFYRTAFTYNPVTDSYSHIHNQTLNCSAYPEKEFD